MEIYYPLREHSRATKSWSSDGYLSEEESFEEFEEESSTESLTQNIDSALCSTRI